MLFILFTPMAQLKVSLSLDNDAFSDNACPEISRILKSLSNDFKEDFLNEYSIPYKTNIRDYNGNKVGTLSISK